MKKMIYRVGAAPGVGSLFITAKWDGHRLSITGVEGPSRTGNCLGSCGQCREALDEVTVFAAGWDAAKAARLKAIWDRWHLNDMRAGSPEQEEWLRENPVAYQYPTSHYDAVCAALAEAGLHPDAAGYRYGSSWKFEEVPAEIIAELEAFPLSDRPHPWGD